MIDPRNQDETTKALEKINKIMNEPFKWENHSFTCIIESHIEFEEKKYSKLTVIATIASADLCIMKLLNDCIDPRLADDWIIDVGDRLFDIAKKFYPSTQIRKTTINSSLDLGSISLIVKDMLPGLKHETIESDTESILCA